MTARKQRGGHPNNDGANEYDERTNVGVSIKTTLQRGTGTDDRDKVEAKVKAATRGEAADELAALRPALRKHLTAVRGWQPDTGDDEGGGQ
jgi:hypothetical protein